MMIIIIIIIIIINDDTLTRLKMVNRCEAPVYNTQQAELTFLDGLNVTSVSAYEYGLKPSVDNDQAIYYLYKCFLTSKQ